MILTEEKSRSYYQVCMDIPSKTWEPAINALKDGYTQTLIAKQLGLSRSLILKMVKSVFSTPDP